jgi:mono/diheme cytochrome c family protein
MDLMIRTVLNVAAAGLVLAASANTVSARWVDTPIVPSVSSTRDTTVRFANDILPIFRASCFDCHGGTQDDGTRTMEAGLDLTSYESVMTGSEFGAVVTAGDPDDSYLIEMVEAGDMPQEGDPLTPAQVQLIRQWIAEGALNN